MDSVAFEGRNASLTIRRPTPGVVVVTLVGRDVGEHGDAPLKELEKDFGGGPIVLFLDAQHTQSAAMEVSNLWAKWLRDRREQMERVHMLTGSRFIALTADFVRRWADLGDTMRIYTDTAPFEGALREAIAARGG